MKQTLYSLTLLFCAFIGSFAQNIRLECIPHELHFENEVSEYVILGTDHIRFSSPAKSDLFHSADGTYVPNKSPRLLFRPDRDFVLSARIELDFKANWDAGDLIIYNDALHWAKFCFETDFQGQPRVVSVVCNGISADDCNSMAVDGNAVHYRIAGSLDAKRMGLYYSEDKKSWYPIRLFFLNKTDDLKIGFCVQSPAGAGIDAEFSEIKYESKKVTNWWTGK